MPPAKTIALSSLAFGLTLMCFSSRGFSQLIIAHRGASGDAPENTLAAFRLAWEQEADGIEGDFRLTADRHIVCLHDADTARVTGGKAKLEVARATLAELQALDVGAWKDSRFVEERIPTLAEVLGVLRPGKAFYLEIKGGPELVGPVANVLANSQVDHSQVVIIAFDRQTVAEVRRLLPGVKALWLVGFERDPATGIWRPAPEEILSTLKQTQAHGLGVRGIPEVVTPEFVQLFKRSGYIVNVWTINDPDLARYFAGLSVDSITTDYPQQIRAALERKAP